MGQLIPLERARSFEVHPARPEEPRFDTKGLCSVLCVSRSTVKRWRNAGMPYEPWSSRCYRYVLSDVLAWRIANRV